MSQADVAPLLEFAKGHLDPSTRDNIAYFLIGSVATYLLPKILGWLGTFFIWIGHLIGGRLSRSYARRKYLNWVVLHNKDLNLTGLVTGTAKPHLEQIFVSLATSDAREEPSKTPKISKIRKLIGLVLKYFAGGEAAREVNSRDEWKVRPRGFELSFLMRDDADAIIGTALLWSLVVVFASSPSGGSGDALFLSAFLSSAALTFALYQSRRNYKLTRRLLVFASPSIPVILWNIEDATATNPALGGLLGVAFAGAGLVLDALARKEERRYRKASELGTLISRTHHSAIVGGPGSGKSTCLQYLALTYAQQKAGERKLRRRLAVRQRLGVRKWRLPILIPIRKVAGHIGGISHGSTPSLINAFCAHILPSGLRDVVTPETFLPYLEKGRCLFLLDGLDEVVDDSSSSLFIDELRGLMSRYPSCQFLLTCRSAAWQGKLDSLFNRVDIRPLTSEQISEFVDTWYESVELNKHSWRKGQSLLRLHKNEALAKATRLKQGLSESASLSRLSENPLLLSIICFVHYSKDLPRERLTLYRDCAELLLVQWDAEKGLDSNDVPLTNQRRAAIMQEIAYKMHIGSLASGGDRKEADRQALIEVVREMLMKFGLDVSNADTTFDRLARRSGLLVPSDDTHQRYVFAHLTFQEFYAATRIHERSQDIFEVMVSAGDNVLPAIGGWWKEVLLLVSVLKKNPTSIVGTLIGQEDVFHSRLQIAAQCIEESVESCDKDLEREVLLSMLKASLGHEETTEIKWPEVRAYLLGLSRWPDFAPRALSARMENTESVPEARTFLSRLTPALAEMPNMNGPKIAMARMRLAVRLRLEDQITSDVALAAIASDDHSIRYITSTVLEIPGHKQRATICRDVLHHWLTNLKERLIRLRPSDTPLIDLDFNDLEDLSFTNELVRMVDAIGASDRQEIAERCQELCLLTWSLETSALSRDLAGLRYCLISLAAATSGGNKTKLWQLACGLTQDSRPPERQLGLRLVVALASNESEAVDLLVSQLSNPVSAVRLAALEGLMMLPSGKRRLKTLETVLREGVEARGFIGYLLMAIRGLSIGQGMLGYKTRERRAVLAALSILELPLPRAQERISAWSTFFDEYSRPLWLVPYLESDSEIANYLIDRAEVELSSDNTLKSLQAAWLLRELMLRSPRLRDSAAERALDAAVTSGRARRLALTVLYAAAYVVEPSHRAVDGLRSHLKRSPDFEAHATFSILQKCLVNDGS